MQQKFKLKHLSIIGVAVLVVVAGGTYIAKNSIEKREQEIAARLNAVQAKLPPGFVQDNQVSKGVFSSTGVYRLTHKSDSFILKYQVSHGLTSWFGGDIKVHSTVHLDSPDLKDIKADGKTGAEAQWAVIDGSIKSNGDSEFKAVGAKIESEIHRLVVEPSSSTVTYSQKNDELKSEATYPKISIGVREKTLVLNNIKASSGVKASNPDFGFVSLSIADVSDRTALSARDIKFDVSSTLVNDKIDMALGFKVGDIVIQELRQKDTSFELAYSLKGLDPIALAAYREIQVASAAELSDQAQQQVINQVKEKYKQIIATGLVLSVDKFKVTSPKGLIDMGASMRVKPVANLKDISIEKNTEIDLRLVVDGEFAQMASLFVPPEALGLSTMDEQKRMNLALHYENNALMVNQQPSNAIYGAQITALLKSFDETLKEPKREARNLKRK